MSFITNVNPGIMLLVICICSYAGIWYARHNKEKIKIISFPAIDAVDVAVGRAVEMGSSIIYTGVCLPSTQGSQGSPEIGISGLTLLGYVANSAAKHNVPMSVIVCNAPELAYVYEVLRDSYGSAFHEEMVVFGSGRSFEYRVLCSALSRRQKPAAVIGFQALQQEGVMLVEGGLAANAMAIGGASGMVTLTAGYLPFLVSSYDYFLISDEVMAAAALVSKDPVKMGNILALDYIKFAIVAIMAVGAIASYFGLIGVLT